MKQALIFFISTIFFVGPMTQATLPKAVVVVPIADLVGQPFRDHATSAYTRLPLCPGNTNPAESCPRIHQLLFNEVVEIIEERNEQVCIKIPHMFFITAKSNKPQTIYWTLKSNIKTFKQLKKHRCDFAKIPEPIAYIKKVIPNHSTIATLKVPYYNRKTNKTYSAGTRFVCAKTKKKSAANITVFIFDTKKDDFVTATIPKKNCLFAENMNKKERIEQFVNLVRQWAHNTNGYIPYVWGGCSFNALFTNSFETINTSRKGKALSYYTVGNYKQTPKSGLDCSSLVSRAAQLCGIPYWYKNTYTLANFLDPVKKNSTLSPGDLILIPGHIMIVSNTKKNKLVESRHYAHGYGKVHEIALSSVFKNIKTYRDLLTAYHNQQPLQRLDSQGKMKETIKRFTLLKLASVWKQ